MCGYCTIILCTAGGMAQDAVTLLVSSLPYMVTVEDLKDYFENQGQSVQIYPTILGGGKARIKATGFTPAGMFMYHITQCE